MNTKKTEKRSTLKCADENSRCAAYEDVTSKPKRRISFSGRKSVREFHAEEKPKSWNNSYEMSDHINSLENVSTGNKAEDVFIEENKNLQNRNIVRENRNKIVTPSPNFAIYPANFTKITYESMNCNNSSLWEIEKINKAVVPSSINTSVPMDISTHLNDSFKCVELLKSVECYNTCNTSEQQKKTQEVALFGYEKCKNIPSAKQVNIPNDIVLRKMYTPTKTALNDLTPKHNQYVCENVKAASRSNMNCSNVDSLSNIGINVDFNSPQCNLSPSFSFNSPLFPPSKCKKLNLRQLNAEIGDGKIVVFPNKNIESQDTASCFEATAYIKFKDHNNETKSRKNNNWSNLEEEQMDDVSVKSNLKGFYDKNAKKNETYFECEGLVSDNTSFLVKEKVGDETALGSTLKLCDEYRNDAIHFNSEIDKFSHKTSCVNPFIVEREVEYVTGDFRNITLSNSDLTSNHTSTNTKISDIINNKKKNDECNTTKRSIYEVQDMSLNKSNMEITTSVPPINFKPKLSEINDNDSSRLDITPQNTSKLRKQRKTIYFDQDIDTVSVLATQVLQSQRNYVTQSKAENNALICTPNQKHMPPKENSSDSFVLNLKEARAALSSNCKPRIEGTPRRSFLEFVYLEREVEQRQICTATTAIEGVPNEFIQSFVTKEIISGQNQKNFNGYENESEREQKCIETEGKKKSLQSNLPNTIIENTSYHKVQEALGNEEINLYETGKPDESDLTLSPIFNSVTNKRLTADFTPNLPLPKKRQTIIFHDCAIDESTKFSDNVVLKNATKSCIGKADLIKEKISESNCREAFEKNQNVLTPNESDKVNPAEDYATFKLNVGNQIKNIYGTSEDDIYQACASCHQMDSLDMISFQSRIPIFSDSIASKINESGVMECSVDTIQLPRHAITFPEKRRSIIMHEVHDTSDKIAFEPEDYKNVGYEFEDNHITISDVSAHYLAQPNFGIVEKVGDVQHECLGDSNKTAVFNKEFINLERENSPLYISEMDDIEKTRLSLVETLLSENADDIDEAMLPCVKEIEKELTNHNTMQSCSVLLGKESNIEKIANVKNATLCRRCKRCQEALSSETMLETTETFALPSMPSSPCLGFERLQILRKRPKLKDVHEYWRRRSLEKKEENLSAFAEQGFESDDDRNSECLNITHIKGLEDPIEALKRIERQINAIKYSEQLETDIFFKNLFRMLSEVFPDWILNYQMRARRIIQLSHANFISFSIEMLYEDRDQLGNQISIQNVYLQTGRVPSRLWKPIDHLIDYNIKINLPFDLKPLYSDTDKEIFVIGLLQRVHGICNKVLKDCLNIWRLICNEQAALIRESNRVIVRKISREVICEGADHYPYVKTTDFQIELNNIRTVSYKDIMCPPLYAFCEELQFLPTGIDFLRIFLQSASSYLR